MAAILLMYTTNNSSAGIQPRPWDETHGQPAGKCGNQTVIADCDGVRLDTNHSQGVELYHSSVQLEYLLYHHDVLVWKHFLRYWPFLGYSTGHPS